MTNLTPAPLAALLSIAGAARAQPSQAFIEAPTRPPRQLRDYNVPGLAVALIRNGAVVWMKGYGFADVASARPITPDTAFNVGSLSKTATAWGVMRLVERGKVELDQPVDAYLKGWRLPPSQFDAKEVTIRRVLSHTAGISNHDYHGWDPASPLPPIIDSLSGKTGTGEVRVVSPPGTGFAYSGADYAIMQLLIESVSGLSFQDYMKAEVFQPLGMKDTGFGLPADFAQIMALPYGPLGESLPRLRYNELAAAGLTMTLRDLATLCCGRNQARQAFHPPWCSEAADHRTHAAATAAHSPGRSRSLRAESAIRSRLHGSAGSVRRRGRCWTWKAATVVGKAFAVPSQVAGDGIVLMTNSSNGEQSFPRSCALRRWAANHCRPSRPTIEVGAALYGAPPASRGRAALDRYRELRRGQPDKHDFSATNRIRWATAVPAVETRPPPSGFSSSMRSSSLTIGTSTTLWVKLCWQPGTNPTPSKAIASRLS